MGYQIVVVDDEAFSLTNAKKMLSSEEFKVSCLRSGADLLKFVEKNSPDLILLDILMPEMDGFETYHALRDYEDKAGKLHIPVIFLTGESNNEVERRGLKAGASDFIRKPFDKEVLLNRINNTIQNSTMIKSLMAEATIDKLTGFLNKSSGTSRISEACKTRSGALIVFDLDSFKLVNDLFGHDMGDRVLVAFAEVIRHNVREHDIVSRIGGDEFMGFFSDMLDDEAVASLSKRLNEDLMGAANMLMGDDHGIPLGISAGVAYAPLHSNDYKTLFHFADSSLYDVKQNGKHGYSVYVQGEFKGNTKEDLDEEIRRVRKIIGERNARSGARLLGQDAFANTYQYIMRFMKRYGYTSGSIIFSISPKEDDLFFRDTLADFADVLQKNLRWSDIVFKNRSNEFFCVCPMIKEGDIDIIIDRIVKVWNETEIGKTTDLKSRGLLND